MNQQKSLYHFNRAKIHEPQRIDADLFTFEEEWIGRYLNELPSKAEPTTLDELIQAMDEWVKEEQSETPPSAQYVTDSMSLDEFRVLVQEFAVDGLTEAQVFYYILPRLTLKAQMPMLRIMIDEFGSGYLPRAHTTLYLNLLRELEMPTDLDFYIGKIEPESFEFVNLFFWLTLRADDPSYFAGSLTYLETTIPVFFDCYTQACKRLGVDSHAYYSEHQHIDYFHAIEGRHLFKAMHSTQSLHLTKAWHGILLTSMIVGKAFDAAVEKARTSTHVLPRVVHG